MDILTGKNKMWVLSSLQLAQKTFTALSATVTKVALEKRCMDFGRLGTSLYVLSVEMTYFTLEHKATLEKDGRIREALHELENVISPGLVPRGSDLPTLCALAEAQTNFEEGNRDTREKARQILNELEIKIQRSLHHLASVDADLSNLIDLIQKCSKIKTHESPDFTESVDAIDESPEHLIHATALYDVLRSHAPCHCMENDAFQQHWAKLRLTLTQNLDPEGHVPFDMLFSVSPDPSRTAICEWQDMQMLVSSPRRKTVRISTSEPLPALTEKNNYDGSHVVQNGEFCSLISSRCGSRLCFRVANDHLRLLEDSPEIEQDIHSTHGATLEDILTGFKLQHGMRPVLAYILARSVWQYYNSDWMSTVWTKSEISFMEMGERDELYYFCKPYVSIKFGNLDKEASEYFKADGALHRFPRVLALGIMLLEIGTGQPTGLTGPGEPNQWDPRTSNEQYKRLKNILKDAHFEADCNFPKYRSAVEKCLDPKVFRNGLFTNAKSKQNMKDRQSILYREVVDKLRQLIEGAGWDSEFDKMEKIPIEPKKISKALPLRSSTLQVPGSQAAGFQESIHQVNDLSIGKNQDTWFQKISLVNDIIKKKKRATGMHSLKIAILDTGCDANAPSLRLPGRKRIKLWKDFVENSYTMIDDHGHGTHLATLILQIAPYAEVCVMRVAKHSEELRYAEGNIVKAIYTAVSEWDVDFVSMSFGFPSYVQSIQEAISKAIIHKKSVTFFAAANNDGFNSREMFPANLGGPVLSIRGTNMHGSFEQKFNPPKSSLEPVFGTLGKNIYSDWTRQEDCRSMSGSSVATAIAVGIASMVLEYATRSCDFDFEELQLMRTRRGIFELFIEIGVCGRDGNEHYYVAPFDFFNRSDKDRLAKIRTAISRHPEHW